MSKAIAGFFKDKSEGEKAQEVLLAHGFSREEVGFLAGAPEHAHETPAVGPPLRYDGSQAEAMQDTWVGAVVGLASGLVAALPDVGLLVAMGPLAGMIGGLAVGGALGGLFGLLKDHGVSEEEAGFYAQGVRDGGSLVTVHGVTEHRAAEVRRILSENGAIHVENLADEQAEKTAAMSHNICGEDVPS